MQWPRATPRVAGAVDVALAVGFSAMAVVEIGLRWDDGYAYGSDLLNIPLLLLVTLPLALRRRAPRIAVAIAFGSVAVSSVLVAHTLFFFGSLLPLALLLYSAARRSDGGAYALLLGPASLLLTYGLHVPPFGGSDYLFGAVLFGLSWAAGRLMHRLETQRAALADALAGALREREARERVLLLDERARIARELHDVVAHAVSLMVVQAGAARFAVGEDDEEARARLLSVEDAGRAAVADLRRLLGLLRADDEDEPQVGDAVPGLAQLPDLAATLGRAGLEVRLDAHGLPEGLPPALDHALYRLVQEALTNVLKHSTGGSAGVRLRVDGGQVAVEVDDPGPARDHGTAHDPLSTGHGLVGLRERIAVFGGRLDAGPAGRGWRLCAEVPLTGGPAALSAAAP